MLGQRRRFWASIGPALGQHRVDWECWQVFRIKYFRLIKGVVNCQNSRDKGPPEGNSGRG